MKQWFASNICKLQWLINWTIGTGEGKEIGWLPVAVRLVSRKGMEWLPI